MEYYKSSTGGVYKVYAADKTTGKVTLILNFQNLGMYTVINQKFSLDSSTRESDYDLHISGLEASEEKEFTDYVALAKNFLNTL